MVDNASRDGSADMVASGFSGPRVPVRLIRSDVNLGFGAANNRAIEAAQGRYLVLLNSDAFFHPGALARATRAHGSRRLRGHRRRARSVGQRWRAGSRRRACFPPFCAMPLFLPASPPAFPAPASSPPPSAPGPILLEPAEVDWVTGAFMILRREALAEAGLFDPAFFLYCEEVDLCRRVKAAGFHVCYWPDIVVTHLHGESSRQVERQVFSDNETQVVLWRMRSMLLYYRKHHGRKAWLARWLEEGLYTLRFLRNRFSSSPAPPRARARGRCCCVCCAGRGKKHAAAASARPPLVDFC